MYKIDFKYRDEFTRGEWSYQSCVAHNIDECIEWYGLKYCEYEIISIKKV